jgi:hypothetical protein
MGQTQPVRPLRLKSSSVRFAMLLGTFGNARLGANNVGAVLAVAMQATTYKAGHDGEV